MLQTETGFTAVAAQSKALNLSAANIKAWVIVPDATRSIYSLVLARESDQGKLTLEVWTAPFIKRDLPYASIYGAIHEATVLPQKKAASVLGVNELNSIFVRYEDNTVCYFTVENLFRDFFPDGLIADRNHLRLIRTLHPDSTLINTAVADAYKITGDNAA